MGHAKLMPTVLNECYRMNVCYKMVKLFVKIVVQKKVYLINAFSFSFQTTH